MAFLSEILKESSGLPEKYRKEASICCECGEKISNGGMWAMDKLHLGICEKCAPILLDWYIDTLLDVGTINEIDDIENVKKLSDDIIIRYKRKRDKKIKQEKAHL